MAESGANRHESFGNRNLWQCISGTGVLRPKVIILLIPWQCISGTGVLRPKEFISRELKRNKEKLLSGLLFYKKPRAPQGDLLQNKKLSTQQKQFVHKLRTFLNLEEDQSHEVFCSYLSQDFRGSQKNLQLSLSTERHCHVFMVKIRDFYYSERLYLLQCVRHVLSYWPQLEHHPYREEYTGFLNELLKDNELIKRLLEQVDLVCDEPLPNWETHGNLMNDRQALAWANQNLKEQHEILEILLVYWKEFEVSAKDFNRLLEKFKRQGFGRRQVYKYILDESMDRVTKTIGFLEVLVLLQAIDMETVERLSSSKCFDDHSLLKDKQAFQSVDKTMQLLGSEQPHGPLLLCWAVTRQLYLEGDVATTRKYGNQALQLNVFDFLSEMLDREPFVGKSMTASLSHCVVYTVLLAALTAFDESTLTRSNAEMQVLYKLTCKLLNREFIAGNVWMKGMEQGILSMFQTALFNFPLDFSTLVKLSTALASANRDSASKVLDLWSEIPRYTEYLDRNSSQDIKPTRDALVWQLARDKSPYSTGDFCISAGVYGQLISCMSQKRVSDPDIPIIQWDVAYDGWQLLKSEIQELLHQVARGAGMVSPAQILRVTDVTQFIRAICKSQPTATDGLADIVVLLYTLIQRFSSFNPPPIQLLGACVDCVTCVAKLHPKQALHDMKQTGLLPFLTENIDNMAELLSGQGLSPGLYGALLAGFEVPQGQYQLTVAFLDLISELIIPLHELGDVNQLQPSVMYILREIFPAFQKWRYCNLTRKELIGHKCLTIAHNILDLRLEKEQKTSGKLHIQKLCVYSMLFMEAGKSLLEIIATGIGPIETLLAQQSSQLEGGGEDLVQLIQVAFSVMNRLLLLRSHDQLSPVEVALSSQPAGYQNQHIVAVIAEYIYHRTNPLLPKLATLFLRRLAVVLPMSILACLGGQGEAIRDIYLMRLQSATEDLGLKTGILELLSVCVDTQPGLIELFLNVQTSLLTATNKDVLVGRTSCLQTVLDLMDVGKQGSYQCPPDLLCACTNFIQALWVGMRETAMAALRAKSNFWPSLCGPLLKDLSDASDEMKTVSYILKVLAQEIYATSSTKLDNNLKKVMKDLAEKGRMKYWSTYVTDCIKTAGIGSHDVSLDTDTDTVKHPVHKLLLAWKDFLVVLSKINVAELKVDDGLKELIIVDLLEAIHTQFAAGVTELSHRLSQTCSALYFTLVKTWSSSIKEWRQVLDKSLLTLTLTMSSGDMIIPSVQIALLGSMTAVLQHHRLEAHRRVDVQKLTPILVATCEVLLQSTRELPAPQELRRLREEQLEATEKSFAHTDHRLKLQTMAVCGVEELIQHIRDSEIWLPILQENMILPALLASAHPYIKTLESVYYIQSLFMLFLTLAQDKKAAESLAMAGLTQHVCLPVTYCYQNTDVSFTGPTSTNNKAARAQKCAVTWHSVYCLCLDLYTTMLATLKFSFLDDAFNFIGSHQDRLQQCLEMWRCKLTGDMFREVEKTCLLVNHLANYSREWRLHLPELLNQILTSILYMCQTFVSLLVRPRYLQYILEHQGIEHRDRRGNERLMVPNLQHQTSTEDIDSPTIQHIEVQHSMLKVLGECFVALRQFSPDLVQILIDQNMDVGEYEPFLAVGFNTPPVDEDCMPTFGIMVSCVNVGLRLLTKMDANRSPQRTDPSGSSHCTPVLSQHIPKSLVFFVLENALYLTMSQGMLYLKDPDFPQRDKQLLKRELATEMNSILSGIQRYIRRGGPQSPASSTQPSPRSQSPGGATLSRSISQIFLSNQDHAIFRLVQEFSKQVLR